MAWRPWAAFWALVASCVAASEPSAQHGAPLRKSVLAAERERVGPALRARMLRPGGGEVPARTVEYLQLRPERRRELEDGTAAPSALPTPAPSALPSASSEPSPRPSTAARRVALAPSPRDCTLGFCPQPTAAPSGAPTLGGAPTLSCGERRPREDGDANNETDSRLVGCAGYTDATACGLFDTDAFRADELCCVCAAAAAARVCEDCDAYEAWGGEGCPVRDDGTAFLPLFDFAASDSVEERRGYDPVGLVDGCAVAMTIEPGASAYFKLSGFSNATASGALPTFFLEWDMSNNEQSLPMFFSRRAASRGGDDSGRC
ncbi:hypothetical protein JL722_3817 [Aureococcus anophagefferens]|nr:hypothetical protein JL722_3817 [Aureococcus anophagefferens]